LIDLNVIDRAFINRIKQAEVHPDIYDCDCALVLANGYPMNYFPPEARFDIFPNFIYDSRQADQIPAKFKPADHSPVAAVKRVKKIGFMATTQVMAGLRAMFDPDFLDDSNLRATVPAALIEWYKSEEGRWFARELQKDFDGLEEAIIYRRFNFMVNRCRWSKK
jgi:hypothetical protein